jgi:hypothetical protein
MRYIVGEDLHGHCGKLNCQLLGSVDAANLKQARREAELRWPDRELSIHPLNRKTKPAQSAAEYSR